MITNEKQFKVTKSQLSELKKALDQFDIKVAAKRSGSQQLARAEHKALISQFEELKSQVEEYQALKSGLVSVIEAETLENLPEILIKARIARRLSQRRMAETLGLKEQQIQRYEAENYKSASLQRLAEVANALNLKVSENAKLLSPTSRSLSVDASDFPWDKFPIDEMYRRNWFKDFSGSHAAARANAEDLVRGFVQGVIPKPAPVFHRIHSRASSETDRYSLFAWQCRVLWLAKNELTANFTKGKIDQTWLEKLVRLSHFEDGPKRALHFLSQAGIRVVVEPHLSRTYLDGAALLTADGKPVIGLTIRYDRLDNFWFALFHEIIHVAKHLEKYQATIFFDDLDSEPDEIEQEADKLAGEALIPDTIWETALPRYIRTVKSVIQMAEQLKIHPAIISGRIRMEANNYTILNELVGLGNVRRHFSEVTFGH